MELRAREKSMDDKSANRLAIALSNERANSKSVADTTSEHSNHAHAAPPSHRAAAESSIDSKIAQLEADRAASAANTEAASTMPASLPTVSEPEPDPRARPRTPHPTPNPSPLSLTLSLTLPLNPTPHPYPSTLTLTPTPHPTPHPPPRFIPHPRPYSYASPGQRQGRLRDP